MQPCSQPRYGLIERSKPMSGESLRAMIVRVASTASVVSSRAGSSSEEPQPSSNGTRFSVSKRPLSLVPAPRPLRGWRIAGAAAAKGEWLLFLHADCRLAAGWEEAAAAFIARPGASGRAGYFALALDDLDRAARRLERLVAWRCRTLALPYGDQGLLIARGLYNAIGGFAPMPLMEDVDLVRRLGRRRLAPIAAQSIASARRHRRDGYVRRSLR